MVAYTSVTSKSDGVFSTHTYDFSLSSSEDHERSARPSKATLECNRAITPDEHWRQSLCMQAALIQTRRPWINHCSMTCICGAHGLRKLSKITAKATARSHHHVPTILALPPQVCMSVESVYQRCVAHSRVGRVAQSDPLPQLGVVGSFVSDLGAAVKDVRR